MTSFFDSVDLKTLVFFVFTMTSAIIAFLIFVYQKRQLQKREMEYFEYRNRAHQDVSETPSLRDSILDLIKQNEDVDMKLLTELYEGEERRPYGRMGESRAIYILRQVQSDLRGMLKDIVRSKEHYCLRVKIIPLIDEAEGKLKTLSEKKPFNDIGDPEKSLLIDILEELPKDKAMPKQKLIQVAEIIKNKYQNIEKLQEENQKSAAWTRWGAFGTIFFGILSLVLSIYSVAK
jgi:hypothetical protein